MTRGRAEIAGALIVLAIVAGLVVLVLAVLNGP